MKTKHILLGLFSLALVGGGIWYFTRRKPDGSDSENEMEAEMKVPETLNKDKVKNTVASSSTGGAVSISPAPFKNSDEGNAFRAWVNKNYPDKAKAWKLDPKGSFDNQYIRKAYAELGVAYQKSLSNTDSDYAAKLAAEKKKLDEQFNAMTKPMVVVTPKSSNPDVASKAMIWIRKSSEVNDGAFHNRLKPLNIRDSAEFVQDTKGTDQLTWYKIKIKNPNFGVRSDEPQNIYGYVRSDVADKKTIRVPKDVAV